MAILLTIRCASCKKKLWKYDKFGKGEVLRCYKSRIIRIYDFEQNGSDISCSCGNKVGIDKGKFIKMIKKGFVYSGKKRK